MFTKNTKKWILLSLVLCTMSIAIYMSIYDTDTNSATAPLANANTNARVNGNHIAHTAPMMAQHQMKNAMANSNMNKKCVSQQMNKLDDCDSDDTPDFGENWIDYINSQ